MDAYTDTYMGVYTDTYIGVDTCTENAYIYMYLHICANIYISPREEKIHRKGSGHLIPKYPHLVGRKGAGGGAGAGCFGIQ